MKAITLPQYQGNIIRALRSLEISDQQTAELKDDQVLITIEAAPCNPSDIAFIQGGYNVKKSLPAIPGFEGTGHVTQAGNSAEAQNLLNKRVSFFCQSDETGSWATQTLANLSDCIVIGEDMPVEQAACFSVNPFTAYAMNDLAIKKGSKAIIQNAAGGQLAGFIRVLAAREGIEVINIVRKEEQVDSIIALGAKHVLCSSDESFRDDLHKKAIELHATIAFDAVGGEQSGFILEAMPGGGGLYLYGALGARTLSEIPAGDIIFGNKFVKGFNMNEWKENLDAVSFNKLSEELEALFVEGVLRTEIQGSFSLKDHGTALMQYIRNMSGGKIIFRP